MDKILLLTKGLIINIFILFAILFIYLTIESKYNRNKKTQTLLLSLFSAFSYSLIILSSYEIIPGVFLDARTVFAGISGLYFGFVPGIIGVTTGIITRLFLGGDGAIGGAFELIVPFLFGVFIGRNKYFKNKKGNQIFLYFYAFSMYVIALSSLLLVPHGFSIIKEVWAPYILIFPLTTVLISQTLTNRMSFLKIDEKIRNKERLIHNSINSTSLEQIFAVDKNYKYLYFNKSHFNEVKMETGLEIKENTNILSYFKNEKAKTFIKNKLDNALINNSLNEIFKSKLTNERYIEARYRQIFVDDSFEAIAVSLIDVTEKEVYAKELKRLNYVDQLTKLHNRRYNDENIAKYDAKENITVVYIDINGLKLINDSFGHHTGDKLIENLAFVLNKYFGNNENIMLARTGGDEFIIICDNVLESDVIENMKLVEQELESIKINNLSILISYGIKNKKLKTDCLNEAVNEAENIMYNKKLISITSHRGDSIKQLLKNFREMYPEEKRHSNRVAEIAITIADNLNIKGFEQSLIRLIADYHDIGKISLDPNIVKNNNLNEEDSNKLKTHPEIGYRIMSSSPEYNVIANDILSHHENFDGTGYPRRLKGQHIPLKARIIAVAETLDCLIHDRYGTGSITFNEALEQINKESGKRFDPKIVDKLNELVNENKIRKYRSL